MRDKTGYIYKITSPSGKIYIGSTYDFNRRFREYKYLKCKKQPKIYNSLNKYGFDNHTIEVIEEPSLDIMLEREVYWGEYYEVLSSKGLNLALPKFGDTYSTVSEETRLKMSESAKGKVHSEESKLKMSNAHKGKVLSEETKRKISLTNKGNVISEEHKKKVSEANMGKTLSEEHKKKISEARKGILFSEEHKLKLSNAHKGRTQSEEHKNKRGKSMIGKNTKLVFDTETGIFYQSCEEASESTIWSANHLSNMLRGKRKNKTNLIYV